MFKIIDSNGEVLETVMYDDICDVYDYAAEEYDMCEVSIKRVIE